MISPRITQHDPHVTQYTLVVPIRPMNAVSTKEARGSAAKATTVGRATMEISKPSLSALNELLKRKSNREQKGKA